MKKIIGFITLFAFAFMLNSCSKEDKTPTPTPTPVLDVRVDGLFDFTIGADLSTGDYETKTLVLGISQTTLSQENVAISIENEPAGIDISFSTKSGVPNYSSTMTVTLNDSVTNGVYPIKLIAKNTSGLSKTYNFTVTVDFPCNFFYNNYYTAQETIDGVAQPEFYTYLYPVGSSGKTMRDNKRFFEFDVNCDKKTVTMYEQNYIWGNPSGGRISGTGILSDGTITLNCILTSGSSPNKTIKLVYNQ